MTLLSTKKTWKQLAPDSISDAWVTLAELFLSFSVLPEEKLDRYFPPEVKCELLRMPWITRTRFNWIDSQDYRALFVSKHLFHKRELLVEHYRSYVLFAEALEGVEFSKEMDPGSVLRHTFRVVLEYLRTT